MLHARTGSIRSIRSIDSEIDSSPAPKPARERHLSTSMKQSMEKQKMKSRTTALEHKAKANRCKKKDNYSCDNKKNEKDYVIGIGC